jgi:flagellar hook-associated protein 1 FlgK
VSGVSLDEEASNLLLYQRAYQAAAQAITTVSQMLETAINMGASSS